MKRQNWIHRLISLLALVLFAAVPALAGELKVVVVDTQSDLAFKAIETQIDGFFENGEFEEIEAQATKYRESGEHIPSGYWKLAALYNGLSDVRDSALWKKRIVGLTQWVRQKPDSVTAQVALAYCYYTGTYMARGMGWAKDIREGGTMVMLTRLGEGAAVLKGSYPMRDRCPGWFAAAQRIAQLQSYDRDSLDAITDEGLKLFPNYYELHFVRAQYLGEPGGGKVGGWHEYAAKVSNELGGDEGDVLYARIVWSRQGYANPTTPDELKGIDWERTKRGFEIIRKGPDPFASANAFARIAWLSNDRETAKSLFQNPIGTHMDYAVWGSTDEFEKAHTWAME